MQKIASINEPFDFSKHLLGIKQKGDAYEKVIYKLLSSLKYYMKKNGQDVTNNANNVMTVNSVASVPKYSEAEKTASVGMALYGVGIALVAIVMLVAFAGL